ncbi:EAL domain-containing protein [Escherichia coli]|nr:EAL domain-containing protein [Escherichia coli]
MKLTDADNAADGIFFPALEQNMMGAVLINENDEVMFFNPAAEKLWGYKREEVIGNNIDMLIPRDLRPAHPEYIRHNREGGKARVEGMSRELQLEKKDGSKIWTRFALSKVSAEGKVYYLALVRDASVEMAQKEQTRQLIIAVDHLDRPVIVLDPERHIVQCNRAFTEMFGYCIFKRIQILRDMGVGLSVDDFGTGFSGLSRLVSLPVTEIKIDKSFVDRYLTEKRILALLEAITSIGQSLNLTVVAEGVETKEQFEMLRKIHCRVIQGYFFSRPLPAEEIPGWMSSVLPLKI